MMKKTFFFTVLFLFLAFIIHAQDTTDNTSESTSDERGGILNFGGGISFFNNPVITGGHIEFGFNIPIRPLFIQNNFLLRALGIKVNAVDSTVLTLSEKVIIGRSHDITSVYIFLEGGAGFYGNSQVGFSSDALVYTFGFGGGFELGKSHLGCFYIETGYAGQILLSDEVLSGIQVQTGWKVYWMPQLLRRVR